MFFCHDLRNNLDAPNHRSTKYEDPRNSREKKYSHKNTNILLPVVQSVVIAKLLLRMKLVPIVTRHTHGSSEYVTDFFFI